MWRRSTKQTMRSSSSGEKNIGCMNGIFKMFYAPSRKMLSDGSRSHWYRRNKNKRKLITNNVERDGLSEPGREKLDAASVNRRKEERISRKILDTQSKVALSGLRTEAAVAANDAEFSNGTTNADDLLERLYNHKDRDKKKGGLYSRPSEESSTSEMFGNPYDDPVLRKTLDEVLENIIRCRNSDPNQTGTNQSEDSTKKTLETLKSNKDLLLKVLQDPKIINILIVKNEESLQQHRAETSMKWEERKTRGKQKMINFSEGGSEDSTPPTAPENSVSQGLRRIVILKPNEQVRKQTSSEIMDLTSPSQSSYSSSSNMENERGPFHYITKEIKKFKRVISVSQHRHVLSTDEDVLQRYRPQPSESQVSVDIADVSEYLKPDDSLCSSSVEQASQSSENTNDPDLKAPGTSSLGKREEYSVSSPPTQETQSNPFGQSWMNFEILNCNGDHSSFEPQILDPIPNCLDINTAQEQDCVSFSGKTLSVKDFETTANDTEVEHFELTEICKDDRVSTCSTLDFSDDQPQTESLLLSSTIASESPKKTDPYSSATVLESLLDKVIIHGSIKTERDAADVFRLPLRKMVFEERSDYEPISELCVSDADFKFDYMRALLEASGLCQPESKSRDQSSTWLFDSSLYDEVETPSGEIPDDLKILFDCIAEVIEDIHAKSANFMPWVSLINPKFRPFPYGEKLIEATWRGLNLNFVPWFPITLEQNVKRDMDTRTWMDIREGVDDIGIAVADEILNIMLEETVLDLLRAE